MALSARRRTIALIALIAVLLPALAILQYRWLGELSGLEQLRAESNIRAAMARFSTEFDAHLASVYANLHSRADVAASTANHMGARPLPPDDLVERVYIVERRGAGTFHARAIDRQGRDLGAVAWPEWLGAPGAVAGDSGQDDTLPPGLRRTLLDEVPAIVVRPHGTQDRWIVAMLDLDRIVDDLIPTMLAGCFEGGIPVSYDVLLLRDDMPDRAVYQSRPGLARADFNPSMPQIPLFAIHGRDLDVATAQGLMPDAAAHRWRILVGPQSGALEAAVGAARFRNLAILIGVLALLAVSVGLLVISMHSIQRAAREQLELVARISHELRTPLATITCAGENLADNLVETPEDAQQYGQLIRREGRRLTKTLGDILLCCRLQARPDAVLNLRPTDVGAVVGVALADCQLIAGEHGVRIDTLVETKLPLVLADREALKMALKNLFTNAIKYGSGHPVRVSAKSRRAGGSVDVFVTVEDDGPGIPADELPRIFEPFYRGRIARHLEIEGSGIGLSIVRQVVRSHGGRIRVASAGAKGTRFTLQLPAIKAGASIPIDPAA
jgi:signal transduction histidine kinase